MSAATAYPVVLPRGQRLDIVIGHDGSIEVRETMPPLLNYERLQQPTAREEKLTRELEWRAVEAKRWVTS